MTRCDVLLLPPPLWFDFDSMTGASDTVVSPDSRGVAGGGGAVSGNGRAFNVDDDADCDDELLGSLDSLSPPASPPLESLVSAACSSQSQLTQLSPARATYLQTLLKRFPCPVRSNVAELQSLVLESAVHHSSQSILNALLLPSSPWLPALYSLCAQLEGESDVSGLQALFALLVAIVNLHDSALLSLLFDSRHALHSLTVLEYDPAIVAHLAHSAQLHLPLRRHWNALRDSHCLSLHLSARHHSRHEASDGSDTVSDCLHQLHRLEYAKDVVLLSHLDDPTAATLSQLCSQQRVHVIHQVQRDTTVHQLCRGIHVAADSLHDAEMQYAAVRAGEVVANNNGQAGSDAGSSGQYSTHT